MRQIVFQYFLFQVGNDDQIHYKTICHASCEELYNCEKDIIGHPQLVNCFMIDDATRQCVNCRCDFSSHLWVDYKTTPKEDFILDDRISLDISIKESLLRSCMDLIRDYQRKNFEQKHESKLVKDVCQKLAFFIRQTAIIPFNHSYNEYVAQCIRK